MPRAVLDPNVLISALITPRGASARLLLALRAGSFELVTSPALLGELSDVIHRTRFRQYVSIEQADGFVELIRRESSVLDDPERPAPPVSEDPGDDYLVALARAASAELVSGDPHLTKLAPALPVFAPAEFLARLDAG